MKTHKGMRSRTYGIAAIILVFVAALAGMRLEFNGMQSLDWLMSDSKAVEGYQWLANNTERDATVLAWWDYADGIEKIGHRGVVINEASRSIEDTENVTSAKEIARKYGANYVLVLSDDLYKYYPVVIAAGRNSSDYMWIPTNHSSDNKPYLKKETVFTRMVNGDNMEGFSKAFDNGSCTRLTEKY